jgi:hypothetical protein
MPSSTSSLPLALAAAVGAGIIVGALLLIVRRRDERDRGASPRNTGTRCRTQAKRSGGGGGGGGGGSMYTVSGGAESARAARERHEARLQLRSDKSKAGKKAKKAIAKEARAKARGKGTGKGTQLTELGGREGTEEGTEEGAEERTGEAGETRETAEMGSTHLLCSMCGVMQARATAFTPRQAKRKEASRKCRACVDAFPPSSSVSRYEKQGQSKH